MGKTPTAVNVAIGFDIDELRKGAGVARSEINSFVNDARRSMTSLDVYNVKQDRLNRIFATGTLDKATFDRMSGVYLQQYMQALEASQNAAKTATDSLGAGLLSVKTLAAGAAIAVGFSLVNSLKQAITYSLTTAVELERIHAAMVTLTGSAVTATEKMVEFRRLDRESPLNFMDFAKSAKTLMGFGVEAKKTESVMRNLAAISMGNAERFQSLSLAFGQVAASGKLAGQEILQMVNAGFNPLQEISRITGESMGDLKKKVEEGKVSFEEVDLAIRSATEAGGRFYGMNEQLLETLGGQFDKLKSDIMMISAEFGDKLVPLSKEFVMNMTSLTPAAEGQFYLVGKLADTLGLVLSSARMLTTANPSAVSDYLDSLNEREKDAEFKSLVEQKAESEKNTAIQNALTTKEEIEQLRIKKEKEMLEKESATKRKQELSDREELIRKTSESFLKLQFGERQWLAEKLGLYDETITNVQRVHAESALAMYDEEQALKKKMKMEEDVLRLKEKQAEEQRKMVEKQAEEISDLKEKHDPQLKAMREMFKLSQLVRGGLDPAIADKAGLDVAKALMQATGQGVSSQAPRVVSAGENRLMAQRMERQMKQQEEAKKIFADMLTKLRGIEEAMKAGPVLRDGRRPF